MTTGPARSGAFLYAQNVSILFEFYTNLLGAKLVRETPEFKILACDGLQLIVHELPDGIDVQPSLEPPRESTIKLFFSVESLIDAQQQLVKLGGNTMAGTWRNPLFSVCNAVDPEGNIFQLREFV